MEMGRSKGYADRVNILKKVRVAQRWKLVPVIERNGKIVRDHVRIAGQDEHHPEGQYYLEWYQTGKRRRQAVGDFENVTPAARRKSIELDALEAGLLKPEPSASAGAARTAMSGVIDRYLAFIEAHRSPRTFLTYRYTLDTLLRESYKKAHVEDVTRQDILDFITHCYNKGLGNHTVYDKLVVVLQLFKRHGKTGLIDSNDWPAYVETIRRIYEAEEIEAMLRHAKDEEAIFLKFLLGSGFRDREVRFLIWHDIDFRNSIARVTTKPVWHFKPKNYEERSVPLPSALVEQLRRLKEARNAQPSMLVFPNTRGNPNSENDMIVKRVAERAKLNCGQCITKHGNRCAEGPY
jgi:integrase